jgi:predicted aspartyl protease
MAGERCADASVVRVPFKFDAGGHMLVAGHLGRRPVWLIVDTGGTTSLIAQALARELRLVQRRADAVIVDAAGIRLDKAVAVASIALGRTTIGGPQTLLVMQTLGENGAVGGTVGLDVLDGFDVAIDNARRTLALLAPGRCRPTRAVTLRLHGDAKERGGLPIVAGTLDGAPARVLIDTGSTLTYVDRGFAKYYFGLTGGSVGIAKAGFLTTPTGATIESWSYVFDELTLAGVRFDKIPVLIADLPAADVTLGQAQLQSLNLHFALAEERIYVTEAK